MGRTVFFTSRRFQGTDCTLAVHCDNLLFEHEPDGLQYGAAGDVQPSRRPYIVTLKNIDRQDHVALRDGEWTHIGWEDEARREEHVIVSMGPIGTDVRCVYKG